LAAKASGCRRTGHPGLIVLLGDPNPQAHFQDAVDLRRWLVTAQR
jgi:D-alanyl-D-alanine endopeptidase (penicillin-binding protein 7)